ncbi:MAG: 50S ribosomal protein L25 [Planctomycetota bacterium]
MERVTLQAEKRHEVGSRAARRLRAEGIMPAVLYGHRRGTVHLSIPARDFERLLHDGIRLLDLEIGGTVEPAIIKDIQYDALGDDLLHADFARVAMDEKLTVSIPVELHGTPKGVEAGGVLDHALMDVEVSCLPADIPDHVTVEVSHLEIGDTIHLRELQPPPGVEFLEDDEAAVASVHPPMEIEEPEEGAEVVEEAIGAEPEVIGREEEEEPELEEELPEE